MATYRNRSKHVIDLTGGQSIAPDEIKNINPALPAEAIAIADGLLQLVDAEVGDPPPQGSYEDVYATLTDPAEGDLLVYRDGGWENDPGVGILERDVLTVDTPTYAAEDDIDGLGPITFEVVDRLVVVRLFISHGRQEGAAGIWIVKLTDEDDVELNRTGANALQNDFFGPVIVEKHFPPDEPGEYTVKARATTTAGTVRFLNNAIYEAYLYAEVK